MKQFHVPSPYTVPTNDSLTSSHVPRRRLTNCYCLLTVDKSIINKKRQDTVELCKMFNQENDKLRNMGLLNEEGEPVFDHLTSSFMYENKLRYKRHVDFNEEFPEDATDIKVRQKRDLQSRDDREEVDNEYRRMKREAPNAADVVNVIAATTSRLNLADQARVEDLVEKMYDDMSESKGTHVKYRKKALETTTTQAPVNIHCYC